MGFRAFLVMDNKVARQVMAEMAENGRKWQEMAEKSSPRLFGRKWTSRAICAIPLLLIVCVMQILSWVELLGESISASNHYSWFKLIWCTKPSEPIILKDDYFCSFLPNYCKYTHIFDFNLFCVAISTSDFKHSVPYFPNFGKPFLNAYCLLKLHIFLFCWFFKLRYIDV